MLVEKKSSWENEITWQYMYSITYVLEKSNNCVIGYNMKKVKTVSFRFKKNFKHRTSFNLLLVLSAELA